MRKRLWEAEVQRQLPAALSKRPRWAAGAGSAATEGVGEEAEAEGGQWLGNVRGFLMHHATLNLGQRPRAA